MRKIARFTEKQIAMAKIYAASTPPEDLDPRIEALVNDLIGRVADKWRCWRRRGSFDSLDWAN